MISFWIQGSSIWTEANEKFYSLLLTTNHTENYSSVYLDLCGNVLIINYRQITARSKEQSQQFSDSEETLELVII